MAREGAVPVVRALHDFSARNQDELSISAGDELEVSVLAQCTHAHVTCMFIHVHVRSSHIHGICIIIIGFIGA